MLVHGFDPTVKGTVSHEFVHLLVAEAAGPGYSRVPAWLNEGLAEYGNIDPTDDYPSALRYGIYTRRIKPLWFQTTFGGTPDDVIIAYGQARSVVRYLIFKYGEDSISELFAALRETLDIDEALKQVYDVDQHGLDTLWREAIGLEPLPSPEELNRQLEKSQTAVPETTPTPAPTPAASLDEKEGQSSAGCSAPINGQAGSGPTGLATLLLLGSPLGLLSLQRLRRSRQR